MIVLRPGQRHVSIPGDGVSVRGGRNTLGAGGGDWWEEGGATGAVAVYQPKGAASLAASYINLANPGTYDAAPGTAPTFDAATGWTFNGSSEYLATGVAPANDQTWSLIVGFTDGLLSSFRTLAGCRDVSTGYRFGVRQYSGGATLYENGGLSLGSANITSGVLCVAGAQGYLNGSADGGAIATSTGTPPALFVGCLNDNGSPSVFFAGKIQCAAIYNTTLTAPQVGLISAAMAAL